MYLRNLESIITNLLTEFRIVYLTGPRQAGKTTLARSMATDLNMTYFTLDNQATLESVRTDPYAFIRELGDQNVVLDEFQYAPNLIPAIKEISDALSPQEKGKFLLTGSADIFRSAKAQEALPGHMARLELYPLSMDELQNTSRNLVDLLLHRTFKDQATSFTRRDELANAILKGGYPEVQKKSGRAKHLWFKSYMEGRLFKDFETLYAARGDYHSKLKALAPYLAGINSNLLKYASISNDLELDDKLVKSYIEILELMFIIKRTPAYLKNRSRRQATRMPKLHFVDTGLACHLLGLRTHEQVLKSQFYGAMIESLVFIEICKHAAWSTEEVTLYHFRNKQRYEVDIVLERDNANIIGIEIKSAASVNAADFKGLTKLAEYAGKNLECGVLFYAGADILPFRLAGTTFYAIPISLVLCA